MVENLLSVTRIQDDTGTVKKEDEVVEEVVSEAIIRLKRRLPDIENAFIHSESDRPIDLRITENPDTVTFHIIDYGKGIDEQTIPLILKGEYTAPRTSDTHRGMGIGLSICNTIVQAHGGKIAAHNHADGAEFLFTLPKGDT